MQIADEVADALELVVAAQESLVADLRGRQIDPSAPSALPGWTRGHLLTHLARNADSVVRRLEASAAGIVVEQYVGGAAGRAAEIEQGRDRSFAELVADVESSGAKIPEAVARLDESAWSFETRSVMGVPQSALVVLQRRAREVVLHHTDLAIGFAAEQWPARIVDELLEELLGGLPDRAERSRLAGWLVDRAAAPPLDPWG